MNNYELYHHGVKGQKWGVRRTAAQLGHRIGTTVSKIGKGVFNKTSSAGKSISKFTSKQANVAKRAAVRKIRQTTKEHKEKKYYEKLHKKKLSQMTDKEIADLTNRIRKEASLKDAKYESRVQNARKFYNNVAKQPVSSFANTYGANLAKSMFPELNSGKKSKKKSKGNNNNNNDDN